MSAIKELIDEIGNLKPFPAVVNQIMSIVEDPKSSMEDVAEVIMYDPTITANLLRTCNSAYFGLNRSIESVQDAITILGLEQVVDLVLLKSGAENLAKGNDGYGLHEKELWKHAVSSALIAREIAVSAGSEMKQTVFTAALLKDIGKVILDRFVSDSFNKIDSLVRDKGFSFGEAEKKVIGIDHAELGGFVAEKWGFSKKMVSIIRHHHMTDQTSWNDLETAIVYLADNIAMMMGVGVGADGLAYRFYDDALKKLEISDDDFQRILLKFNENMDKVENLVNVV